MRLWSWIDIASMNLKIKGESKFELITKLVTYSILYGLFHVNYIDLVAPCSSVPAYHLWLVSEYFSPFLPILFLLGFRDWELLISMGLIVSLMNDLFYYPIGILYFHIHTNLTEWYLWQLGFGGFDVKWYFNGGFFQIPVSSLLMGLSIYSRIILIYSLCYKWWTS